MYIMFHRFALHNFRPGDFQVGCDPTRRYLRGNDDRAAVQIIRYYYYCNQTEIMLNVNERENDDSNSTPSEKKTISVERFMSTACIRIAYKK